MQAQIKITDKELSKEIEDFKKDKYRTLSNAQFFVMAAEEKMKREKGEMKKYHVAVASAIGIDTVLIDFEDKITMDNIKSFGDKAICQAEKQALQELRPYYPKIISWQVIE